MKSQFFFSRVAVFSMIAALVASSIGCMTTYDSYGRPVQSVDPGAAVAGAAAAGILGYAIANNRSDRHHHHHHHAGRYRGGGYGGYRGDYHRGHRGHHRGYYR